MTLPVRCIFAALALCALASPASAQSSAPVDVRILAVNEQLAATRSEGHGRAVMAFTNPGGIRTDIAMKDGGAVSYAGMFAAQPFRNRLVTLTLTGAQIREMLEQQWRDPARVRILQVSPGFSYSWDAAKAYGEHVDAASMKLNGIAIEPAKSYRVTVNDYLALGGDGFAALKDGSAQQYGIYDDEALFAFFGANSPIAPGPPTRISRIN
jgi:5'-nucleotidase